MWTQKHDFPSLDFPIDGKRHGFNFCQGNFQSDVYTVYRLAKLNFYAFVNGKKINIQFC